MSLPIYSIAMPGSRLYIVNSPDLVPSLQRQPTVVSFWFIEAQFTARLGGMSQEASQKLTANLQKGQGDKSLLITGLKATHQAMMPGERVNHMVRVAAQRITSALDKIGSSNNSGPVDLWHWVRHEITIITTDSVYGPLNPYRRPEVENAFWFVRRATAETGITAANDYRDFADNSVMLLTGIAPSFLAPKGSCGREKIVLAMEEYFNAQGHKSGSTLIQARFEILKQAISLEDIARFECVNGIALLVNTVPAAFWTIYHVFSDAKILQIVRDHSNMMCRIREEDGVKSRCIDFTMVKDMPILTSILHESLRHRGSGTGPRLIMEDIVLDERYLLQKGSYLILPQRELNFNVSAWGESRQGFDPYRFVKRIHPGAFRGWGGGANLCPGKGFATMEIVALVVMLALRYDMQPALGRWTDPHQDLRNISLAISPPKAKVLVTLKAKEEDERGSWIFAL